MKFIYRDAVYIDEKELVRKIIEQEDVCFYLSEWLKGRIQDFLQARTDKELNQMIYNLIINTKKESNENIFELKEMFLVALGADVEIY